MKSIDIKIENARKRAEAERQSNTTGTTFESREQYEHLGRVGAPVVPPPAKDFEDTAPGWADLAPAEWSGPDDGSADIWDRVP